MGAEHQKDFDGWNKIQKELEDRNKIPYFHEGEVWFCRVGTNLGFEQDGKGKDFRRPVLKIGMVPYKLFQEIKKAASKNIFGS